MKRILALLLAVIMICTLAACGKETADNTDTDTTTNTESSTTGTEETTGNTEKTDGTTSSTEGTEESTTSTPDGEHTHSYGNWKPETVALVNRTGTDKRTCSTCSAAETRENTENVLQNSFYDPGLERIFYCGFNYDGSLRAYSLLQYAPYRYSKFAYKVNSTDTIFDSLAKSFVIDSSFKYEMRAEGKSNPYYWGYDEANDTFTFEGDSMGSVGYAQPLGYVHNGGKQYAVYYSFEENNGGSAQIYKVVLEFNRTDKFNVDNWSLNGQENKYLSFEKVSSVPGNLTK